ncbi:MAG: hypothetical protein IT566_05840 [Rhodospirillaceae bacterium]|nr:hypothetical protein [Rhodospirillaceae bacterium]
MTDPVRGPIELPRRVRLYLATRGLGGALKGLAVLATLLWLLVLMEDKALFGAIAAGLAGVCGLAVGVSAGKREVWDMIVEKGLLKATDTDGGGAAGQSTRPGV